jgi:hypothetical protein
MRDGWDRAGGARWTETLLQRQLRFRRCRLNLPSQHSFNWTGGPPFHRCFVLRGLSQSPGSSRRLGFLTESQSNRPSRLCSCRSRLSLCHHRAIRCGLRTSSSPHPEFARFARTSSISIRSQAVGPAMPSTTFIILSLVRGWMTLPRISVLAG